MFSWPQVLHECFCTGDISGRKVNCVDWNEVLLLQCSPDGQHIYDFDLEARENRNSTFGWLLSSLCTLLKAMILVITKSSFRFFVTKILIHKQTKTDLQKILYVVKAT